METSRKDIINVIYQSTLLAGTTIGYSCLLNIGGSPSTAGFEEIFKLGAVVGLSNMTLDYLYQQGIIPHNIIKM